MSRLFTFLKESDAESIRRRHRRQAKEIAASMSKRTSSNEEATADTTVSRRSVERTAISKRTGREAGPVSNTDGKLYLPSVGGGRYNTGTNGLVTGTVCQN